jgi:hypothetical protein
MSKLAFGAALPLLLALELAAGTGASRVAGPIERRTRWLALASFAGAGLAALALYSGIVDWRSFVDAWARVGSQEPQGTWELADLLPGLGASRIFVAAEPVFLAIAAAGCWLFLRDRPAERRRALWLCAYGGYGLAIFAYRVLLARSFLPFHYSFALLAVAAPFFGYASDRLWRRWSVPPGWRSLVLGVAWLAGVHGIAAVAVVDARRQDARAFARIAPVFPLVAGLEPGERLGVVRPRERSFHLGHELDAVHGLGLPFLTHEGRSILHEEFESFFTLVPHWQVPGELRRVFVPALDTDVVLLPAAPERAR